MIHVYVFVCVIIEASYHFEMSPLSSCLIERITQNPAKRRKRDEIKSG